MGLGYDALKRVNKSIILASISGSFADINQGSRLKLTFSTFRRVRR